MSHSAPILLAEDNEHDVFFMERAFAQAKVTAPLVAVPDGQQAIWYLEGRGMYADREKYPEPRLMLLDLKMPRLDGFDVLVWIQQHPELCESVPVLVLSTSGQESDKEKAFRLGAHDYLI